MAQNAYQIYDPNKDPSNQTLLDEERQMSPPPAMGSYQIGSTPGEMQNRPADIQGQAQGLGLIAQPGEQAPAPAPTPAAAPAQQQSGQQGATGGMNIGGALGTASSLVNSIGQSQANDAMARYSRQEGVAQQMDKYWFNPNNDIEPKLNEYLKQHPSETDALYNSRILGGKSTMGSAVAGEFGLDPGTNALAMTAKAFGNEDLAKRLEYSSSEGIKGMVSGASTGATIGSELVPGVGTIVGGIIGAAAGGMIQGFRAFFRWGSASDDDKKRLDDFNRQYKILQQQRQKRITAQSDELSKYQTAKAGEDRGVALQNKLKAAQTKKDQMQTLFTMLQKRGDAYQIARIPGRN